MSESELSSSALINNIVRLLSIPHNPEYTLGLQKVAHLLQKQHVSECTRYEFCTQSEMVRREFILYYYESFLSTAFSAMNVEMAKSTVSLIERIANTGPAHCTFEVLSNHLDHRHSLYIAGEALRFLDQFTNQQKLNSALLEGSRLLTEGSDIHSFVQAVISIPDKCANRFHRDVPRRLQMIPFRTMLARTVLSTLHTFSQDEKFFLQLRLLGELTGKLCVLGFSKPLWQILMQGFMEKPELLISRILHKLISCIPASYLESSVLALVSTVANCEQLSALLGNAVLTNVGLRLLLTDKIFLQRVYTGPESHRILYSVIGYLAGSPSRVDLFSACIVNLLTTWADPSHLRHVSLSQHMYMSKALVVFTYYLTVMNQTCSNTPPSPQDDVPAHIELSRQLLPALMSGVQSHLHHADPSFKRIGMAVAEIMSPVIAPQAAEERLKFDYSQRSEFEELEKFSKPPCGDTSVCSLEDMFTEMDVDSSKKPAANIKDSIKETETLDSDDDELEPIHEFKDVTRTKNSAPVYLRDCIHGLTDNSKVEKLEASIKASESIIKRNPEMTREVSVEFVKVLLHIGDSIGLPEFQLHRHRALVALAVTSPQQVAPYLAQQFYVRDYTVRQRLDMLETLATASTELSTPVSQSDELPTDQSKLHKPQSSNQATVTETWREVIDKRVAAKTRRFAHPTVKAPEGTVNRFASVASHFFFPLLQPGYVGSDGYSPLSSDTLLPVTFLVTLGRIVAAAINSPHIYAIARDMLAVVWQFRYAKDVSITRALLFDVAMTILSLPSSLLANSFQEDVLELRSWLEQVCETASEPEIQELAGRTLAALQTSFKKGLEQNMADTPNIKNVVS